MLPDLGLSSLSLTSVCRFSFPLSYLSPSLSSFLCRSWAPLFPLSYLSLPSSLFLSPSLTCRFSSSLSLTCRFSPLCFSLPHLPVVSPLPCRFSPLCFSLPHLPVVSLLPSLLPVASLPFVSLSLTYLSFLFLPSSYLSLLSSLFLSPSLTCRFSSSLSLTCRFSPLCFSLHHLPVVSLLPSLLPVASLPFVSLSLTYLSFLFFPLSYLSLPSSLFLFPPLTCRFSSPLSHLPLFFSLSPSPSLFLGCLSSSFQPVVGLTLSSLFWTLLASLPLSRVPCHYLVSPISFLTRWSSLVLLLPTCFPLFFLTGWPSLSLSLFFGPSLPLSFFPSSPPPRLATTSPHAPSATIAHARPPPPRSSACMLVLPRFPSPFSQSRADGDSHPSATHPTSLITAPAHPVSHTPPLFPAVTHAVSLTC